MINPDDLAPTRFSVASTAVEEALNAARPGKLTKVFGRVISADAGTAHGCPGEVVTDVYFDGSWHVGVSVWYECDSYLDVLGNVTLPF